MPQNRNKLIDLFIGNISIAVIHEILIEAIKSKEIADYYQKEAENAINISKKYREKINPVNTPSLIDKLVDKILKDAEII